ncbi:MAG: response regulator [Bacteroidetes bacterium]|nr:MAG: response regulator [Bacteroidota bacterium]
MNHTKQMAGILAWLLWVLLSPLQAQQSRTDSLKQALATAGTDSVHISLLNLIAQEWLFRQPDSAIVYADLALAYEPTASSQAGIAQAYRNKAIAMAVKGDYKAAIPLFKAGLALRKALQDPKAVADSYNNLGNCYLQTDQLDSAMSCYIHALKLYDSIVYANGIAAACNGIAEVYIKKQEHSSALQYALRALRIREETGPENRLYHNYNRLGNIYYEQDSLLKARSYFEQALANSQKFHQITGMATAYSNLGNVELKRENYLQAQVLYQQALEYYHQLGQQYYIAYMHYNLARAGLGLQSYQEAISQAQTAIELARKTASTALEADATLVLAKAYEAKGAYPQALNALHAYSQLKDSLNKIDMHKIVAETEARYENEQLSRKNQYQQSLLEREQREQRLILISAVSLIIGLLAFFLAYRNQMLAKRRAGQLELQLQQERAAQLEALNQMKSRFFANISHEFRTPLTLILGPISNILQRGFRQSDTTYLHLIKRNAERLLQLVEQLMELAKIEQQPPGLQLRPGNLENFLKGLIFSFYSLAEEKHIVYECALPEQDLYANFDHDKLEKILINLLSNAFKFTPEGGNIRVEVSMERPPQPGQDKAGSGHSLLHIKVSDTGIGMSQEEMSYIFERYYQAPNHTYQGAGIGLSLAYELVRLMGGSLEVHSEKGKGSTFVCQLPLELLPQAAMPAEDKPLVQAQIPAGAALSAAPQEASGLQGQPRDLPLVLLVEDHADMRNFIAHCLAGQFRVIEAAEGQAGWELAKKEIPDLIISDIMMPGMDGLELTRLLKSDEHTSHIPVILLTAKGGLESKIEGLQKGADDYLVKPFSAEELKVRMANLIELRKKLRAQLNKVIKLEPEEIQVHSMDEAFIKRVIEAVTRYMDHEAFGVEDLGREVGMSRSQLHRKLTALTGMSPSLFIRHLRLKRAHSLLEQQAGTAAEIAYTVGFSSPAYFSKCFKEEFGITPGEVKKASNQN